MVTRWLIYNNQRVRFVFIVDGKLGDPPPYSQWLYLGTLDERTKEPLKQDEVERRFARGEAPVPLPQPRPKAPAIPFEQANIAIKNDDEDTALRILRPIAERGDPKGQFMVGELYYLFKKQNGEALKWFRLAAGQGHPGAMYFLGNMHHNGNAVPQNFVEAYKWYSLAASRAGPREAGEMDTIAMATQNREGVARNMTSVQIADAQRLAKGWKPAPKRLVTPGAPTSLSPK
jgi:TPR repeat protein